MTPGLTDSLPTSLNILTPLKVLTTKRDTLVNFLPQNTDLWLSGTWVYRVTGREAGSRSFTCVSTRGQKLHANLVAHFTWQLVKAQRPSQAMKAHSGSLYTCLPLHAHNKGNHRTQFVVNEVVNGEHVHSYSKWKAQQGLIVSVKSE